MPQASAVEDATNDIESVTSKCLEDGVLYKEASMMDGDDR